MEFGAVVAKKPGERLGLSAGDLGGTVEMDETRQAARRELSRRHRPVDIFDKAPCGLAAEACKEGVHARKQFV